MKTTFKRICAFAIIVLFQFSVLAEDLVFAVDNLPLYLIVEKRRGSTLDLLEEIYSTKRNKQVRLKLVNSPLKRSISLFKQKKVDAILHFPYSESHLGFVSDPLHFYYPFVICRNALCKTPSLEGFQKSNFASFPLAKHFLGDALVSATQETNSYYEVEDQARLAMMLQKGRINHAIMSRDVFIEVLKANLKDPSEFSFHPTQKVAPLFVLFRTRYQRDCFNNQLRKVIQKNVFDQIMRRNFNDEFANLVKQQLKYENYTGFIEEQVY